MNAFTRYLDLPSGSDLRDHELRMAGVRLEAQRRAARHVASDMKRGKGARDWRRMVALVSKVSP